MKGMTPTEMIDWLKDQRRIGRFRINDKHEDDDLSTFLNQLKIKLNLDGSS